MTKVLIACEFSGIVRDAFIAAGADALSCDLLDTERPGPHYKGDVRDILGDGWDLMIAHPPCTHLAISGARWFDEKRQEQKEALDFVRLLLDADIPRIALENPISVISTKIRKPTQIVQPWFFGHAEKKPICLWLKNLPRLRPTKFATPPKASRIYYESPGPERWKNNSDRWKNRSRFFEGVAKAMADQWT